MSLKKIQTIVKKYHYRWKKGMFRSRLLRDIYGSLLSFRYSLTHRQQISKALNEQQIRLIMGWRNIEEVKWEQGKTLWDTIPIQFREKLEGFPFYYRGDPIDSQIRWDDFLKRVDKSHLLEIATRFISEKEDGNFNSMLEIKPSQEDLSAFRMSALYAFLTAGSLGSDQIEHEMLIKNLDRRFLNEKVIGFDESHLGWDVNALARVKQGEIATITYTHLYFALILLKYHRKQGNDIIEIGGGYGGFARVLHKLDTGFARDYMIVDLPFVSKLQDFFLSREVGKTELNCFTPGKKKYHLIDLSHLDLFPEHSKFDIAIATHSLSELDPEQINSYLDKFLFRSSTILLSMRMRFPINQYDTSWIAERIEGEGYSTVYREMTFGGRVLNAIFRRRTAL